MDQLEFPMNTTLTSDQVIWLYRCLLGRNPESEATISWFLGERSTFEDGRNYLRKSEEFRMKNPNTQQLQYYIPEQFPQMFRGLNKKLALATIVKDESAYVENMLRSCAPLICHAVIVDTGSSDDTVAIVHRVMLELEISYSLHEVPFRDFAQARNAALERVPNDMDWIIMLDADEELVPSDYWRFTSLLESENVDAWHLPRFGFSDAGKRKPVEPYPDFQLRLLRNRIDDPIRFAGHVHERPCNARTVRDAPVARCEVGEPGGPHIHHLGFMDITREKWQKKHDFYTRLASLGQEREGP